LLFVSSCAWTSSPITVVYFTSLSPLLDPIQPAASIAIFTSYGKDLYSHLLGQTKWIRCGYTLTCNKSIDIVRNICYFAHAE
jgi:hypothetical protein